MVEEGNCKVSYEWVTSEGSKDYCNDVYGLLAYYVCACLYLYILLISFSLSPPFPLGFH